MDYIEYELNKYNEAQEHADEMERLGFETEEEYINYIESKEFEHQEAIFEEKRLQEIEELKKIERLKKWKKQNK